MRRTWNDVEDGIKAICALALLGALAGVPGGVMVAGAAGTGDVPGWFTALGGLVVLFALLNVPAVYGVWMDEHWSWAAIVGAYVLNIGVNAAALGMAPAKAPVSAVIGAVLLVYVWGAAAAVVTARLQAGARTVV